MRKTKFQNENFYHIFNRGVDKRVVFCDEKDYLRFLLNIRELNNNSSDAERDYEKRKFKPDLKLSFGYPKLSFMNRPKLAKIICFTLLPNHYHFLFKQISDNGIEKFMQKIGTAYTKYFNSRHNRSGSLFQGTYKSVAIKTDPQLLYIASYINGNAEIHGVAKAENWQYGSYLDYIGKRQGTLSNKKVILDQFKTTNDYIGYTKEVIKNSKSIKDEVRQYLLE